MSIFRRLVAILLLSLAPLVAVATPAVADTAECAGLRHAEGGYEVFDLDTKYVPPPLRTFSYDCATRIADRDEQTDYLLIFANTDFAQFVSIIRSFEDAGWLVGPSVSFVDGNGVRDSGQVDADGLADIEGEAQWATSRFSNNATGRDIVSVTYTDGVSGTNNDAALDAPSIYIEISINEPYGATGLSDPSVLSNLRSFFDVNLSAAAVGVLAGGSVMLMLVVGYPGALIGKVIDSRYDQLSGWVRKGFPSRVRALLKKRQPRWLIWIGFLVAAILACFVDPAFGVNEMSARMLVTGFASFALFNVLGWAVVKRVALRLEPDSKPYVSFHWASLLIVIGAVLIARLLEFSPGVIFGLVAGLTYAVSLVGSRKAIVVLVGSGFALALGLIGWIAYSVLGLLGDSLGVASNLALVTLSEFFSGVTIEGISSLPLALLPFAVLDGGHLLKWRKWVWGAAYASGLAAFMLVLVTIPDSFAVIPGDFIRWLVLFGAYALIALGVWWVDLAARQRKARAAPAQNSGSAGR